jgi:hypothetical protein
MESVQEVVHDLRRLIDSASGSVDIDYGQTGRYLEFVKL